MAEDKNQKKDEVVKIESPLVFISHDTRDAELAEAFSGLLKSVSAGILKTFRTSDKKGNQGIDYGIEWYPEIIKNIQKASDVVCLLTERSVNRPWILFEAGMAKGKLETPILGVALGISLKDASSGPFAQFQNCGDDEDSLIKLVVQLVKQIPNSEPDENTIQLQVAKFKESISEILKANNKDTKTETSELAVGDNSSAKLFEEIKVMFKELTLKSNGFIFNGFRESPISFFDNERGKQVFDIVVSVFFSIAKPATQKEIRDWEIGFKETHGTSKKVGHGAYFVNQEVIVPPLHGANSISVIVAKGVKVHGVQLHSHNNIFYIDGFRTLE